jgi:uncharacterized membrane protein YdfJ with MMPL/SSD domain
MLSSTIVLLLSLLLSRFPMMTTGFIASARCCQPATTKAATPTSTASHMDKMDLVLAEVATINKGMDRMNKGMDRMKKRMGRNEATMQELKATTELKFDELKNQIGKVENEIGKVENQLTDKFYWVPVIAVVAPLIASSLGKYIDGYFSNG